MFASARLKLTAWYLLIAMLISVAFSVAIYKASTDELERFARVQRFRIERRIQEGFPLPPEVRSRFTTDVALITETKRRLLLALVAINAGIFIIAGTVGYFLAGRTLEPIQDMVDEQHRFISDASHELRTPLTALKSSLEVHLRDKNFTLKQAKTLIAESIEDVNKLHLLSDNLLQLAQYQKASGQLSLEKVSLSTIMREAVQKVTPLAKQKNITIKNTAKDMLISGDMYALTNAFITLLDNAVKYSDNKKTVSLSSKKTLANAEIFISDQGIGISRKDMSRIFDRFYRADSARSKSVSGGYGLGLSIAKKIIEAHAGSISVESKLHKGTTFTVRLPLFS